MAIRTNPELATILNAETTQYNQVRALDNALTATKRIKAKWAAAGTAQSGVWGTGTLFRDAALTGSMTFSTSQITGIGVTSNLTTCTAVDLSTVSAVLRIEGNGHWLEGTVGLPGSGCDFIMPVNPTATNSIAVAATLRLRGASNLVDGSPDVTPPTVTVALDKTAVSSPQTVTVTASPQDNTGVSKVEFYRSGLLLATKTAAPWTVTDSVGTLENGTRHYYAKAYDAAGNTAESSSQPISVSIAYPAPSGTAVPVGSTITSVTIQNTATSDLTNVPLTFAHVFKVGDLPSSGANVELQPSTGSAIPCQIDVRDTYADGSVKHAVISLILPTLTASASNVYAINRKAAGATPVPPVVSDFAGLDSVVTCTDAGVAYSISLATLLQGTKTSWLSGDVVSEWEVAGNPKDSGGNEHAYLHVRFCVRGYKGQNKARVDIVVENTWAMTAPKDLTYDVAMTIGGTQVYSKAALVHYQGARYRTVGWWNGTEPTVHIKHDIDYLISTNAVPNYDRTVTGSTTAASNYKNNSVTNGGPMGHGCAEAAQGTTGGRPDIGILPGWAALYVISMYKDAKDATLNQGNQAGSWGIHVRDKNTGKVISFNDYPNFPNGRPAPVAATNNPNTADRAHHPDQSFIPYLVTGDVYHLEELQFWAMYCAWSQNYVNRQGAKGIVRSDQPRAQGWCLRTFGHAAWVTPPGARKTELEYILKSNLDWYNTRYTNSSASDARLGGVIHNLDDDYLGYTMFGDLCGIANFMDDHFNSGVGRVAELGYTDALPLLSWKAKYTVGRLYGVPGVCWIQAAGEQMRVRTGGHGAPIYTSLTECYKNTMSPAVLTATAASNCATQEMADAWNGFNAWSSPLGGAYMDGVTNASIGDMDGYSDSPTGYPSNLQSAIAYCATFNAYNARHAWDVFMGRSVKPDYSGQPQFAIVPRN